MCFFLLHPHLYAFFPPCEEQVKISSVYHFRLISKHDLNSMPKLVVFMNGLSQSNSASYFHLLSCIGISKHRGCTVRQGSDLTWNQSQQKTPNWFNLLCGHMTASISIKAFKDKLKYSELVSLVWGLVVCLISDSSHWSCVWRVMVFLCWLPMLCVGFLWLGKTQVYFSSHFYNLFKKQLFDSYLGLAC